MPIFIGMEKGWLDNVKDGFSGLFSGGGNKDNSSAAETNTVVVTGGGDVATKKD